MYACTRSARRIALKNLLQTSRIRPIRLDHCHIGWQGSIRCLFSFTAFSPLTISHRSSVCFKTSSLTLYSYSYIVRKLYFHKYLKRALPAKVLVASSAYTWVLIPASLALFLFPGRVYGELRCELY